MTDPRLAWFAIGASCSAVMFAWPWHPRFSRYSRTQDPDWRRSSNHENTDPPQGPPPLVLRRLGSNSPPDGCHREYLHSPSTVAECGGPCEAGPEHCHCGQLWRDVPVHFDPGRIQRGNGHGGPTTPKPAIVPKPQPPSGRVVDIYGRVIGYIPRSRGDTPNPPPTAP